MTRFTCPQCDHQLRAPAGSSGKRCKCPRCWGQCIIPASMGEPAQLVRSTVTFIPSFTPQANHFVVERDGLHRICMCCGRDTLRVVVHSTKAGGAGLGRRAGTLALDLAATFLSGGQAQYTDTSTARVVLHCRICERCEGQFREVLTLLRVSPEGIEIGGVASRYANEGDRTAEEEVRAFERAMSDSRPAARPAGSEDPSDGDGFDWSALR